MTVALSIKNLRKTYPGGVEALKGIDLEVEQGDFFALLGPNGAGKSTAIGVISSLVNKSSGDVEIFGKSLDKNLSEAKQHLGLVPQEFNFNQFEAVFDILISQAGYYGQPRKVAAERAEYYLKKLDLWDKRKAASRTLSGGMKRRLMIARALVHQPQLLILDEPTAGVDIELRRHMWGFLKELNENGTTIILTTHYLEEAEHLCRNIAIIDQGKIVENTSMQALLSKLDKETFVFDIKEPVIKLPSLDGVKFIATGPKTIEVEIQKNISINQLFNTFDQSNIEISSMRNKSNRLEELFISLVETNAN
ncbi:MAG: ABC transporter [Gammaproteobacteria bacterium]|nr:MAG: ABC transporter [Gammaproteobacteria bacterium]